MASSLDGCVASLRSSISLLDSSISILDSGVNDFPRLAKVLQTTRHFELTSESQLQSAQSALLSEISPEVAALLDRVAGYLDKLERREKSLIAKYELQAGRLNEDVPAPRQNKFPQRESKPTRSGSAGASGAGAALGNMKAMQLRQKKERLSYAVERLEMQAKQQERRLRMSMAAPGP
ncbi:mitotic spindle biogenesis protein Spc19 [Eremomyces bilateralis CBS 781.70]|uniref:DASH complex subunit SPC19 n=1 Tax=Eremomyces bilateralis CBS 781.70 TaxID=1392243 RepID=A0A6G1FW95_9PEZI|nr:mitotic spindle biogenesis protein Spc19 [Eremomyces bilateralis CBS 781.70]KAF1809950.1 mitotic spindle biogenesis protein Spc19 [Eremomyces bilateralis CBS 781.70]